ncbi:MAG TPA: HAMP domain-containing sensor histidine kinase [Candidatus Saccharimonadales bacterium]|nr:HAMP domain-containing sensor histidine kinase [Candidatus Saccharimonadales bacterium]
MSNMFRSAVFKLTAVFLAIVMTITIGFSVVLYNLAVRELQTGFQNQYVRWLTEYAPYGLRQPGNPAAELNARSHRILIQIIYFNILVFLLTGVASYLLAKRVLRPIERAHELQKRFTADVSHELRTPLTALKMDTEVSLLDPKASSTQLRETLQGNLEEAQRMENLVNNLLQLASLEAGQLRTEFERVNIRTVAENALSMVRKYAESRSITIVSDLQGGEVVGSQANLTQLALILLENAIKYSPEGSAVYVNTKTHGHSVRLTVEDSGKGIPPEALPHIFDRFYRADNARTTDPQHHGFGLGLSLAKLIADLHDAEIVLSSTPGMGTQAAVQLPAAPKEARLARPRSG